jgi:hypothetical protein
MSQSPPLSAGAPSGRLGVIDAMRMAWRLLMSDFWMLWLLALLRGAVVLGIGLASCCLCCFAPVVAFFTHPPLTAGFFRGLMRRVDGRAVEVGDLFAAFQYCYWPSVLAGLPLILTEAFAEAIQALVRVASNLTDLVSQGVLAGGEPSTDEVMVMLGGVAGILVIGLVALVVILVLVALQLFFRFALVAIWDTPASGTDAIRAAWGFLKTRFWSVIGLGALFWLVFIAAFLAGALACLVGLFITLPAATAWYYLTMVYLYRSWTGQALVQPIAAAPPAPAGGPIPPTSIEPAPGP